jgi:hypothetical protein
MSERLGPRAQEVQDEIGWANADDPREFAGAVLQLARHVTALSTELDRLRSQIPEREIREPRTALTTAQSRDGSPARHHRRTHP